MKAQTIASKKWADSAGLKIKAFKLEKGLVSEFEETCRRKNEAQAAVITRLMNEYIKEVEK